MEITIIGSGGFLPTGLPFCNCELCKNATINNKNSREGPSIYIHDLNLLIDTPENIFRLLPKYNIKNLRNVIFSHWHPDHTQGCRLFEYLHYSVTNNNIKPVVYMNPTVKKTFKNKLPSIFYYAKEGFISIQEFNNSINIIDSEIKAYELKNGFSVAYLIESNNKKVLICMDHSKDLEYCKDFDNVDLFILNLGMINIKNQKNNLHHFHFDNVTTFDDNLELIKKIKPKKVVFIHIEPIWNLSYEDYLNFERRYKHLNIIFGYDGMKINV